MKLLHTSPAVSSIHSSKASAIFIPLVSIFAVDPSIYIPDETIQVLENSHLKIRATVYSSDLNSLVIKWYHEGSLISTTNDPHYSESTQGMNLHTLNIARVELSLLGKYEAVVTAHPGDRNHSDAVQLIFLGILT